MRVQVDIRGTTALLMHNVRLANPLAPETQRLAEETGRKAAKDRTAEDWAAIARAEFEGGLYHDDEHGPYVPTLWLEAALKKGGGLTKEGTKVQRALIFEDLIAPLAYDGPRDMKGLWADANNFAFTTTVKNPSSQARIQRTRPQFRQWAVSTTANLDTTVLEIKDLLRIGKVTGDYIGLGDWRPRYGRFEFSVEPA